MITGSSIITLASWVNLNKYPFSICHILHLVKSFGSSFSSSSTITSSSPSESGSLIGMYTGSFPDAFASFFFAFSSFSFSSARAFKIIEIKEEKLSYLSSVQIGFQPLFVLLEVFFVIRWRLSINHFQNLWRKEDLRLWNIFNSPLADGIPRCFGTDRSIILPSTTCFNFWTDILA